MITKQERQEIRNLFLKCTNKSEVLNLYVRLRSDYLREDLEPYAYMMYERFDKEMEDLLSQLIDDNFERESRDKAEKADKSEKANDADDEMDDYFRPTLRF